MRQTTNSGKSKVIGNCLGWIITGTVLMFANATMAEEKKAAPGAPRLLPEKSLAYIRIENANEFREEFASSATGKMLADPKLKPIASEIYVAASEIFQQVGDQLGVTLDELLAIPQGQFAFGLFPMAGGASAVAAGESNRDKPKDDSPEAIRQRLEAKRNVETSVSFGSLVVIETGKDDSSLRKILSTMEQKLIESGHVARRESIKGITLVKLIRVDNERQGVEYFSRDGMTVIGSGIGAAQAALARWNGDSTERTLAESTDFAAVMSPCIGAEETRPQITFFIDPYHIFERLIKGSGGGAAMVWPIVESLGLNKIRGIGGSVFQGGKMFEDISHMHVLLDPPRDGIFSVVRPSKGETNPPAWVPEDIASYMSLNWRVDKTFDGFERIFDQFAGKDSFSTRVVEPYKQSTGLDLRESLVNTTNDRAAWITWMQRPVTFNSGTSLVAIELKDPAEFTKTIDKLRETIWKSLETDTIGTTKIYVGPRRADTNNPPPGMRVPEPCGAIVGDWLMMSDSRQLLEHVILAQNGSIPRLASQPDYALVASEIGGQLGSEKPFMFTFARASESLRHLYDLAKSPQTKEFLKSRSEQSPVAKRIAELIERNELPPFDQFKKYFAPSGGFAYDEPTGMHYGRYTLKAD